MLTVLRPPLMKAIQVGSAHSRQKVTFCPKVWIYTFTLTMVTPCPPWLASASWKDSTRLSVLR